MVRLPGLATLDEVDERLHIFFALAAHVDCILDRRNVNGPHLDGEVIAAAGEEELTVVRAAEVSDLVRVCDQAHGLVEVAGKRHLDEADDFLGRRVDEVVILRIAGHLELLHLGDLTVKMIF